MTFFPVNALDQTNGHIWYFGCMAVTVAESYPKWNIVPLYCNEVLAMVTTVMQARLSMAGHAQPVFLNAPRQSGKTVWLMKLVELLSVLKCRTHRVIFVTKTVADAQREKEKSDRIKNFLCILTV